MVYSLTQPNQEEPEQGFGTSQRFAGDNNSGSNSTEPMWGFVSLSEGGVEGSSQDRAQNGP